jgi:hypothetical protein
MKYIIEEFKTIYCLIIHGLIKNKIDWNKGCKPYKCQICGRWWEL